MRQITKAGIAFVPVAALVAGFSIDRAMADSAAPNLLRRTSYQRATLPNRVFAVVNADGSKLRGRAVASTSKISAGTYDVRFNRDISKCAWTGTVGFGSFGGSTAATMISVSGRAGTNNGLFVQTFNGSAVATDEPFTVLVVCS